VVAIILDNSCLVITINLGTLSMLKIDSMPLPKVTPVIFVY